MLESVYVKDYSGFFSKNEKIRSLLPNWNKKGLEKHTIQCRLLYNI